MDYCSKRLAELCLGRSSEPRFRLRMKAVEYEEGRVKEESSIQGFLLVSATFRLHAQLCVRLRPQGYVRRPYALGGSPEQTGKGRTSAIWVERAIAHMHAEPSPTSK